MNIGEEKAFIYGMMKDITEERRKLTDQYYGLKERLDALTKLEEKGVGELSTKGFMDLFNDRETQIRIANMHREVEHAIERKQQRFQEQELPKPRYDKAEAMLLEGQRDRERREQERRLEAERAMQEAAAIEQQLLAENREKQSTSVVKPPEPIISKVEIELAKERESKKGIKPKSEKKRAKRPASNEPTQRETYEPIIVGILEAKGGSMRASEIREVMNKQNDEKMDSQEFGRIIYQIKTHKNSLIENFKPGHYRLKK